MKLLFLSIMILILGFSLFGCGGGAKEEASGDKPNLKENQLKYEDEIITLDDEVSPILEKLGDPIQYDEYPSCLFEGKDKLWDYGSIRIQTYPEGDKDYVFGFQITDEKGEIASGIKVGDSVEDLEKAYGDKVEKESMGIYVVKEKDYWIDFYMGDEKVNEISIYKNTQE